MFKEIIFMHNVFIISSLKTKNGVLGFQNLKPNLQITRSDRNVL
jgi:hypothetical protein